MLKENPKGGRGRSPGRKADAFPWDDGTATVKPSARDGRAAEERLREIETSPAGRVGMSPRGGGTTRTGRVE